MTESAHPSSPAGLRRLLTRRPPAAPGEVCEMCAEPLPEGHSHIANLERRSIMCACRNCHLLFTGTGAARGRYRAVPERYLHVPDLPLSDAGWDRLQIPVRMVFLFRNAALERLMACYPSPAGATEAPLPPEAAEDLLRLHPAFSAMADDVEALLLHRHEETVEGFLLPIDACYRLVGLVRTRWRGFDGGEDAWRAIGEFLAELRARGRETVRGGQGVSR